jgi:hypothetical protein
MQKRGLGIAAAAIVFALRNHELGKTLQSFERSQQ